MEIVNVSERAENQHILLFTLLLLKAATATTDSPHPLETEE